MRRLAQALLLALLGACTGTDVGNPPRGGLSAFDTPGCKSVARGDKGLDPPARVWQPDEASYSGLQCFLWDRTEDGALRVRVTNYGSACHADEGWRPRAIQRGPQAVDLLLESPECLAAGCGWCIYDLLFVLDGRLANQPELTLRLLEDADCSDNPRRDEVKLPLAGQKEGAVCNYANPNAMGFWALTHDRRGTERMPCGGEGTRGCAEELTCSAVDSAGKYQELELCLARCARDADCAPRELMRCEQGTCRLAEPH